MEITSTVIREEIKRRTGRLINRQTYRKLHAMMVEAGHAKHAQEGKVGRVQAGEAERYVDYMVRRFKKIEAGEWSASRPYKLEDVQHAT